MKEIYCHIVIFCQDFSFHFLFTACESDFCEEFSLISNVIVKVDFVTLFNLQVVTSFRIQTGTSANTAIKGIEFACRGRCVANKEIRAAYSLF